MEPSHALPFASVYILPQPATTRSRTLIIILSRHLLPNDALERNSVSRELADTLRQLVHRHRVLVEVESELRLILQIALLLNVQAPSIFRHQLLRHRLLRIVQLLQQCRRNGQIITTRQLRDLADIPETRAHDNGLVAEFLVVVEDLLHGFDARVVLFGVVLLGVGFVPVQNAADEGGDEEGAGFGGGDGLDEREHEGQVAVDAVLALQLVGGLDAFPGRRELDQDAGFVDAFLFVELDGMLTAIAVPDVRECDLPR